MQGKVSPDRSAESEVYVGIDVCKAWLDVYIHPVNRKLRMANDRDGITEMIRVLAQHQIVCIVTEATGKYHRVAVLDVRAAARALRPPDRRALMISSLVHASGREMPWRSKYLSLVP